MRKAAVLAVLLMGAVLWAAPQDSARGPQPKSQAEYEAFQAARSENTPSRLEAAATSFAQRFPESSLRGYLFQQAMARYQEAGQQEKALAMAREALKFEPANAVALLTAAEILAEQTSDVALDREDRYREAEEKARLALEKISTLAAPAQMSAEQFAAAQRQLRGTAHEVLGTVAFKRQQWPTGIEEYRQAQSEEQRKTDALLWLRLSICYEKTQQLPLAADSAERAWQSAAPGSPVRELAEKQRKRLETLAK